MPVALAVHRNHSSLLMWRVLNARQLGRPPGGAGGGVGGVLVEDDGRRRRQRVGALVAAAPARPWPATAARPPRGCPRDDLQKRASSDCAYTGRLLQMVKPDSVPRPTGRRGLSTPSGPRHGAALMISPSAKGGEAVARLSTRRRSRSRSRRSPGCWPPGAVEVGVAVKNAVRKSKGPGC